MSALAELRSGAAGEAFALDLQRTIRAVAVARNFPPPEGHRQWDADAIRSVASEFLTDRQTPRRLADLALHCASEQALRARLQGTVRNFLADLGRRTPIGKLVVRINDVLSGDSGFVRVDGRWARSSGPSDPGDEDLDRLSRAIRAHDVVVPAWGHDAQRAAPVADRATVVSLCGALLDAAGGSLPARVLAQAIGHRVGLGQAPLSLDIAAFDEAPAGDVPGVDTTGHEALRPQRAAEVFALLNDRERLAIAYPEYSVRQLAPLLAASPSQSHLIRARAVEVIRRELLDDEDAEGIARTVIDMGRMWAQAMDSDTRSAVLVAR